MRVEQEIQTALDDLGAEIDLSMVDLQSAEVTPSSDEVAMQTLEAVLVEPYTDEDGRTEDQTLSTVLDDGNQVVITVKKRPQCPSCYHIVSDPDESNNLAGVCSECGTQTCPQCKNTCSACGTILCPYCTTGHGLEGETYCTDCKTDVDDDVAYKRETEREKMEFDQLVEMQMNRLREEVERGRLEISQATASHEMEMAEQRQAFEELIKKTRLEMDKELHEKDAKLKDAELANKAMDAELKKLRAELEKDDQEWRKELEAEKLRLAKEKQDSDARARDWNVLINAFQARNAASQTGGASRNSKPRVEFPDGFAGGPPDGEAAYRRRRLPSNYPDPDPGR